MPKIAINELQERLRNKWPDTLTKARELRYKYPDPVQALVDLLDSLLVDNDTWKEIVEEPYA